MKIRSGFVSNSSSSSFVISADDQDTTEITIRVDISNFISKRIKTKEELLEYMIDEYGHKTEESILSDSYCGDIYSKSLQEIDKGKVVCFGSVSNDDYDNPIANYLYQTEFREISDSDGITVINASN